MPLNGHQDSADLAVALNLPVVLVIGLRLDAPCLGLLPFDPTRDAMAAGALLKLPGAD